MIYLGADHGGFVLKEKIKQWLKEWGYFFQDLGNTLYEESDDYPQFAFRVAEKVAKEEKKGKKYPLSWEKRAKGILCCRSAAGMVIAANKVQGARAVAVFEKKMAAKAREHNDSNILALSGDGLTEKEAKEILETWLKTEFSGEKRHLRRLLQIEEYEKKA